MDIDVQNCKKILFGDERYIKEVIYVCEDILSLGGGYEYVLKGENIEVESQNSIVILCSYDISKQEAFVKSFGLEYGKSYIYATDFFKEMDREKNLPYMNENRKIAIWGCGMMSRWIVGKSEIADFYIDRNPDLQGKCFLGKPVLAPEQINDFRRLYIYIAIQDSQKNQSIVDFLQKNGLEENVDFFRGDVVANLRGDWPSKMLYRTINDRPIKNFLCTFGMKKIDIYNHGNIYVCCMDMIDIPIGNILGESSILDIWNSYTSKIVRLSFVNQTYSFCNRATCGEFVKKGYLEYHDIEYAGGNYSNRGTKYPEYPVLDIDYSCNLRCESCRKQMLIESKDERKETELLAEKICRELMPNVNKVGMAGSGEVFYSPSYRKIWINKSELKRKEIVILSNGILFNEANWNLLENGYEIIRLNFSLDAASNEVYEKVRIGGVWEVVLKNMEFASVLRRKGKVAEFNLRFCYQQKNYKDMKAFILLAKKLGCDHVFFDRIRNWGTYSNQEFTESISLFKNEDGLGDLKEEYYEYFNDSIFDDPIIVGFVPFIRKT